MRTSSKRLAAIDIGSNSVRLLVAEASPDGSYRILDDEKQTTRLAAGLAKTKRLGKEAMNQSVAALRRMKAIAEGYGVQHLQVIATSAVREAANRRAFLRSLRERLELPVKVIAPLEEADLSYRSVARHFDLKSTHAVIVDLGGGSAELALVANGVAEEMHSLPLGAVRLTESYLHSDPVSDADFQALRKHIKKCVRRHVGKSSFAPQVMIGSGGTFMALAQMAMRRRGEDHGSIGGFELNRGEVLRILNHVYDLPVAERRAIAGLHADRADIILAGLTVIERLMKHFHVNQLRIHDRGVRDGLLLRMIQKAFHVKVKPADEERDPFGGVWQFAQACAVDRKHAQQVAKLSRQLFDQLQPRFGFDLADGLLLEAAAILHEAGNLINYEKHHQHTYHLIMHGDFRGLSSKQRELVANIARYHRRALPRLKHATFRRLPREDRETVRRLSALLRLADGLDRTHMQRITDVQCKFKKGRVILTVTAPEMPDIDLWGAKQKGRYFEKLFDVELQFCWASPSCSRAAAPGKKRGSRAVDSAIHAGASS